MENDTVNKERLLEALREEVATLLCADDISEEEKLARIKRAQEIIEQGAE
jgi:hypothetical protein